MRERRTIHVSLTEIYMSVICIFPIATALVEENMLNKLLFSLLIGLQITMLFDRKARKRTFVMMIVLAINYTYTVSYTRFPIENINLLIYFPFYLVYTYFMCDNSKSVIAWFQKRKKYVIGVVTIWTAMVGVSIFYPGSYYVKEGGASYFGSFVGSIFRLGQSAMFIQALIILMQVLYGTKKAFWLHSVPMYSYFMGSSRTYLLVGLCFLLVSWYFYCDNKKKFNQSLIPLAALVVIVISVSSMGDKIAHTLDEEAYGDFWFKITSSRSVLWEANLNLWKKAPFMRKLLGVWINFSYRVAGLWSHNDFVELLGSFGLVGIGQYLVSIYVLFKTEKQEKKMPKTVSVALVCAWLFNAFFNMHYVYICAMLAYPILVLGIKHYAAEGGGCADAQEKESEELIKYADENNEILKRIYQQWS